jgi:RNA polymerase sigma-70 factor (ECF subfamily)
MLDSERRQLFEALLSEELHAQLWRYCTRLAATREDAEDLLQEALARAYRKLHQLREPAAARAWLFSIARSLYINQSRRSPQIPAESLWLHSTQAQEHAHSLSEPIAEALAGLPLPQRELLALFYLDGLTLEECGSVLGAGPQVAAQRLYRARRALRRELEKQRVLGLQPRSQP